MLRHFKDELEQNLGLLEQRMREARLKFYPTTSFKILSFDDLIADINPPSLEGGDNNYATSTLRGEECMLLENEIDNIVYNFDFNSGMIKCIMLKIVFVLLVREEPNHQPVQAITW